MMRSSLAIYFRLVPGSSYFFFENKIRDFMKICALWLSFFSYLIVIWSRMPKSRSASGIKSYLSLRLIALYSSNSLRVAQLAVKGLSKRADPLRCFPSLLHQVFLCFCCLQILNFERRHFLGRASVLRTMHITKPPQPLHLMIFWTIVSFVYR